MEQLARIMPHRERKRSISYLICLLTLSQMRLSTLRKRKKKRKSQNQRKNLKSPRKKRTKRKVTRNRKKARLKKMIRQKQMMIHLRKAKNLDQMRKWTILEAHQFLKKERTLKKTMILKMKAHLPHQKNPNQECLKKRRKKHLKKCLVSLSQSVMKCLIRLNMQIPLPIQFLKRMRVKMTILKQKAQLLKRGQTLFPLMRKDLKTGTFLI